MGKVTRVRKELVGSAVFVKLVRSLVFFGDPACAENRLVGIQKIKNNQTLLYDLNVLRFFCRMALPTWTGCYMTHYYMHIFLCDYFVTG